MINLTHSIPLKEHLQGKISTESHSTRENLSLVLSGKVDYSMISIVDYFKNKVELELVEGPTITGLAHSMSNLFISNGKDPYNGMKISVSSQTETTAFFLRLVLNKTFPVAKFLRSRHSDAESMLKESDFALVIGDDALSVYNTSYRIIFDVTHMFSRLYNLYSIYAVTVKRKGTETPSVFPADFKVNPWEKKKSAERINSKISSEILDRYFEVISYDFDSIISDHVEKLEELYNANGKTIFES